MGRRASQLLLLGWAAGSAAAALQPPGVGGAVRAVDAAVFMLFAPALAGVLAVRREPTAARAGMQRIPFLVELGLWCSASVALLVLIGTALLVAGVWCVPVMAAIVATETLVLTLWPGLRRPRSRDV